MSMSAPVRTFVILILVGLVAGCGKDGGDKDKPGAASVDALLAAFEREQKARNLEGLTRLVSWERVEPEMKQSMTESLAGDLDLKLTRVYFSELGPDEMLEYTQDGVVYRPSLPPIGRLNMEFEPVSAGNGMMRNASGYLVGEKDRRYYIVTAAPALE